VLLLQVSPVLQALPQAPQLASLDVKSMQAPLHAVWFAAQPQVPLVQTAPAAHGLLQPPQWSALV
jgi:hypothetical protein